MMPIKSSHSIPIQDEKPIWQGRACSGMNIKGLVITAVLGSLSVISIVLIFVLNIIQYDPANSAINIVEFLVLFMGIGYYFYKISRFVDFTIWTKYAVFKNHIEFIKIGIFPRLAVLRFSDISTFRLEHFEHDNSCTIHIATNQNLKFRFINIDEHEKRLMPAFERISDGLALFDLLHDLHSSTQIKPITKKVPKSKSEKWSLQTAMSKTLHLIFSLVFFVLCMYLIDVKAFSPNKIHDTIVRIERTYGYDGTDIMAKHMTAGGYTFQTYSPVSSEGGKIVLFVSPLFDSIIDVHSKAGVHTAILLSGLNGFALYAYLFSFLTLYYAIYRLSTSQYALEADEMPFIYIAPLFCIAVCLYFYVAFN